ncbi:MAG: DUF2752 domain-containing protein [Oscillospiraceae bacterium]|nr:DUF2752 domain-containing protein [Oscillospiraceae bacterium]
MEQWDRERLRRSVKKCAYLLAAGTAYLIFVKITGWGIPCLFHLLTGKFCPGCGITRMFAALAELDLPGALRSNALALLLLPFCVIFGLRRWLIWLKTGSAEPDLPEKAALLIASVLTVAFWILRNTETFSWLAPG